MKQQKLQSMFAKQQTKQAAQKSAASVVLEQTRPPCAVIKVGPNLQNTLEHHKEELERKRTRPPQLDGQEKRRRRTEAGTDDLQFDAADARPLDMTAGDTDGLRYIEKLRQHVGPSVMPTHDEYLALISIIRMHPLHGSKELALQAFSLLQQIAAWHPAVAVGKHPVGTPGAGQPYLLLNGQAWTLMDSKDSSGHSFRFSTDLMAREGGTRALNTAYLPHLVQLALSVALGIPEAERKAQGIAHGVQGAFGELLMWQFLTAEFERDLAARLAVFRGAAPAKGAQEDADALGRRRAVLQKSLLFRALSQEHVPHHIKDEGAAGLPLPYLVRSLMQIVAVGPEADISSKERPCPEALAFNAPELARTAAACLNAMLELYGALEDVGKQSRSKTRDGQLDNRERRALDHYMFESIASPSLCVLKTPSQKRTFLQALKPRDAARLLGLVIALKRVRDLPSEPATTYLSLRNAYNLYTNHTDIHTFLAVDPIEALEWVASHLQWALKFFPGQSALDTLVVVVTGLGQAGARLACQAEEARGHKLAELDAAVSQVVGEILSKASEGTLSPASLAALGAVKHCVHFAKATVG